VKDLSNLTVVEREQLLKLAQAAKLKRKAIDLSPITPVKGVERQSLSFAQQRLWFLSQIQAASRAYHLQVCLRLNGAIDISALRRAIDRIVARHEILRTTFTLIDGQPVQRIASELESRFLLVEQDLRRDPDAEDEKSRLEVMEAQAPFDLEQGPLIRGRLIRLEDKAHVLLLTMHHIVFDGWSMGVLINELGALYGAYRRGDVDPLPALSIQYADYAAWQRRWMAGEVLQRQSEYWKATLSGAPARLEAPTDYARPAQHDFKGASMGVFLDAELTAGVKALSRRHGATPFITLLSGWGALLGRLSAQEEVVVGTPVANRNHLDTEGLIGFFVNTLALRLDVSGAQTAARLLERTRERALSAQQHQDIPFEQVVEMVRPERSSAHSPLFQVTFTWQNAIEGHPELPGLSLTLEGAAPKVTAKFDLSMTLSPVGEVIVGELEYATSLFKRETIERYLRYYSMMLKAMVEDEWREIERLPLLAEEERRQVLEEWNDTKAEYPSGRCIHELFEEQAARTPHATAVVYGSLQLTYAELNARANRLAHNLRGLGVRPGGAVVTVLERSIELIVGQLAILKCGAAYAPVDPSFPRERQAFIIADSGATALLARKSQDLPETSHATRMDVENAMSAEGRADDLKISLGGEAAAYVMYTSGSTGGPKGVVIPHRAIGRLVINNGYASFEAGDGVAFAANPAFDAATMEVWAPLLNGGRIVVVDREAFLDPRSFAQLLERHGVTALFLTTAIFNQYALAIPEALARLRYLFCGGEKNDPSSFARVLEQSGPQHLVHCYGPTETTTFAITHEVTEVSAGTKSIPLGRPISNTQIYILDANLQPTPIGVTGEIYIGGAGVARGYLNRPESTEERFLADSFSDEPGARMYRTGDLGRWLPDGTIEFLGRNDFQVKIRGFRIELGEIEARLAEQPGVREAVVVAREDTAGDKRLVAYYTSSGETSVGAEQLRTQLTQELPEYMAPAAYVHLERMPLTANGKLDRKALPAPDGDAYINRGYEAPVGETEAALAEIWAEVLVVERVGRHDNFFELGGNSLSAMTVIERTRRAGLQVDVQTLFATPTVAQLAVAEIPKVYTVEVPPNRIPNIEKQSSNALDQVEVRL